MAITFVSLGKNCTTSWIIQEGVYTDKEIEIKSLRNFALPFDWTYVKPEYIVDAINDNFTKWLDLTKIKVVTRENALPYTQHIDYPIEQDESHYVPALWPNHDLTDPKIYKSMQKRVERFTTLLKSNVEIVFFTTFSVEEFQKFKIFDLFKFIPKKHYVFLYITPHLPPYTLKSHKLELNTIKENIFIIQQGLSPQDEDNKVLKMITNELYNIFKNEINTELY